MGVSTRPSGCAAATTRQKGRANALVSGQSTWRSRWRAGSPSSFEDREAQDECRTRRSDLPVSCLARVRHEGYPSSRTANGLASSIRSVFAKRTHFKVPSPGTPETSTATGSGSYSQRRGRSGGAEARTGPCRCNTTGASRSRDRAAGGTRGPRPESTEPSGKELSEPREPRLTGKERGRCWSQGWHTARHTVVAARGLLGGLSRA
jgi:hypothetical protein